MVDWVRKQEPTSLHYAAYKRPTLGQKKKNESERIEKKIFHTNKNDRKAGLQYLYQAKQILKQKP